MTTIKTSCPVCGDVELTPAQMRLVGCSRSEWSFYAFLCGTCQDEIRKPADDEVVTLLVSGGVVAEQWSTTAPPSRTTTCSTSPSRWTGSTCSPR